jgi:hypothetical protein
VSLNNDFLNLAPIDRTHEIAEHDFRFAAMLLTENTEDDQENQRQDQPEGNVL